jgi:hypothetical protein
LLRLAEEDSTKAQSDADGFFHDAQTFDCTVSIAGAVGAGEGLAQQFNQRVVPTLDTPQSASGSAGGF